MRRGVSSSSSTAFNGVFVSTESGRELPAPSPAPAFTPRMDVDMAAEVAPGPARAGGGPAMDTDIRLAGVEG
jgi:hypothetical protein